MFSFQSCGTHGKFHISKQRSGWGIIAKCRPSAELSAATPEINKQYGDWNTYNGCAALMNTIPHSEPLGLRGYCVVSWPSLSINLKGNICLSFRSLMTVSSLYLNRPKTQKIFKF